MITVLTWLWAQPGVRSAYTADHVNIWAAMVRRNTKQSVRIACVTDTPEGIHPWIDIIAPPREFENVRIPTWPDHRPQCLRRLTMFRPDAASIFGQRFVCMDLDCVIANPLDPIINTPHDFRICKGTAKGRPYNGSLIVMTAGARPKVYTEFSPEGAVEAGKKYLGSDQAWIAHCLPNEATFDLRDGVMMSHGLRPREGVVMFYPGAEKPWNIVLNGSDPWVAKNYRDDETRRAIYLGYGKTVWDDAKLAIRSSYAKVFSSPEAAQYWPGSVQIVRDDEQAIAMARMLGYSLTICGATIEGAE